MVEISEETRGLLERYAGAVAKWTKAINLVASGTVDEIWTRHISDCLQVLEAMPETPVTCCDLGSGAGFPGLVTAIVRRHQPAPERHVLIESDRRKAAFLKLQASELNLKVDVLSERIETARPVGADVITARALAPLGALLFLAKRHAHAQSTMIFMKGADFRAEIIEARKRFDFTCEAISNRHSEGKILVIRALRPLKDVP